MNVFLAARAVSLPTEVEQRRVVQELLTLVLEWGLGLPRCDCELGRNESGKPFLIRHPELGISWSHCAAGAVAVATEYSVGVDIEQVRPGNWFAANRMFTETEQRHIQRSPDVDREFFRLWTLKESYLKAIGSGLSYPLQTLEITNVSGQWSIDQPHAQLHLWEELPELVIGIALILSLDESRNEIDITPIHYRRKI